jgi:curved DNA-binding protein CbpA
MALSMNIPDPYKVLEVDSDAGDDVIEAAYKRLAKKYHPDVAPGPYAQERMARINQAREMLRDPMRRAAVDRARTRASATSARVAASDGRVHAGHGGRATHDPHAGVGRAGLGEASGPTPPWPIPGMRDPGAAGFPAGSGTSGSTIWPSGRSSSGAGYDAPSMGTAQGTGAAGPPPGNPSGSRLAFGRYAGWTLGEIARTDPGYLEWLDRMPIGRIHQAEIDVLLRKAGLRTSGVDPAGPRRGLFRR